LALLQPLFGRVVVPPAVAAEIAPSVPTPPWMGTCRLTQPVAPLVLRAHLGAGEREALSLALEIGSPRLLVDERAARRLAEALGVPVVGTLGILLAAKRRGHIPAIRPLIDSLRDHGFWIAPRVVEQALLAAGEGEDRT
jgi:predicted nucleic acid-binding protein